MAREYLGLPSPELSLGSHQEVLVAIKEVVEVLTRQRGDKNNSAAMLKELTAAITEVSSKLIEDAPHDGNTYGRKDGTWVIIPP